MEKMIDKCVWTSTHVNLYLKLFCLNDSIIKKFIKEARIYILIRQALDPASVDFEDLADRQRYLTIYRDQKQINRKPEYPAIWDLTEIDYITETPMHLAMGVQKAVLRTTLSYGAGRGRQTEFVNRCTPLLKKLKSLNVDTLPILTFKDEKFGGYVAENYRAITMILPWLSRILEEESMQPTEDVEPPDQSEKPYAKWNGKECKAWMAQRGIRGLSSVPAAEAKQMVRDYLSGDPANIPAVVVNHARHIPPGTIRQLALLANGLFSVVMATDKVENEGKNRTQAIVSMFLTLYHRLDQVLFPKREKPVWLAKYNILGLLRVPQHFIDFRLVRNLYEGGSIGEGMVKQFRLLCPRGVRDGWSKNVIRAFYRQRAFDSLFAVASENQSEVVVADLSKSKFKRYKALCEVMEDLKNGFPLSVIIYRKPDRSFAVGTILDLPDGWFFHEIQLARTGVFEDPFGYSYFEVGSDILHEARRRVRDYRKGFSFCSWDDLPWVWVHASRSLATQHERGRKLVLYCGR